MIGLSHPLSLSPIVQEWRKKEHHESVLVLQKMDTGFSYTFEKKEGKPPFRKRAATAKKVATLEALEEIFGRDRIIQVLNRPETRISKQRWKDGTLSMTKKVARRLFVALAQRQVSELGPGQHQLHSVSLPFDHYEDVFLGRVPRIVKRDRVLTAPHSEPGRHEKVWVVLNSLDRLREESLTEAQKELIEEEALSSRLADREPTEGLVVPSRDGLRYVERVFAKGGAYIFATRSLDPNDKHVHFVCRGTAFRRQATGWLLSGINDLLPEIGSYGIQLTWPEIAQYVKEQNIITADISGKSLGGAHARYLSLLLAGKTPVQVKHLTIVCPVNVSQRVNEIYHALPKEKQFTTHHIRNGGADPDLIPWIGENSWGDRLTVFGTTKVDPNPFAHVPLLKKVWAIVRSLSRSHTFQYTLGEFESVEITDPKLLQEALKGDPEIERLRQGLAKIVHFATFGKFSQQTFSDYYASEEASSSVYN